METNLLVKATHVREFEAAFHNAKKHDRRANILVIRFDEEYFKATIYFSDVQFLYWLGRYDQLSIDLRCLNDNSDL